MQINKLASAIGTFVAALLFTATAHAQTTRTVCASGCDHTDLQAAIDASTSGDTITAAAGETFIGNFILRAKTLSSPITIRSSASDGNFPSSTGRVDLTHIPSMPNIVSPTPGSGLPVFRTEVGAHDYILKFLNMGPVSGGFNAVVLLGTTTDSQQFYSDQPYNITVDRSIIRGGQYFGQKIGIQLNGRNLTVNGSYIDRIMGQGQDAVGIGCVNGSGPLTILNNHVEATAENMICGGADPQMKTFAEVSASPAPTTTSATLTNFRAGHTIATARVGQAIALLAGANTLRHHTYIRSCGTANTTGATCNGNNITFDVVPSVPDSGTGSDARWGEIFNNILVRRNHFYKDPAWFQTILPAPSNVQAVASTSAGSLAAGTYYYRVLAENQNGYNNNATLGAPAAEVSRTLSATGQITLTWNAVPGATRYRVYGRISGGTTGYLVTSSTTLTDTGSAMTAATTVPNGNRWVVKNLFEIKFGTNWQIDSNIFENHVTGSDSGTAIWLKSNNTDNTCEFCQTKDVVFENNIIRNVAGGFNILARNDTGAEEPFLLENLTIRNNLMHWSNSSTNVGTTSSSPTGWGSKTAHTVTVNGPTRNVWLDHNTLLDDMGGGSSLYFTSNTPQVNFDFTNNLMKVRTNGIFCASIGGVSYTKGISCFNAHSGGGTLTGNALAGGAASAYPGNLTPTISEFEGNFQAYQIGGVGPSSNYALDDESVYIGTATDGLDRGANIAGVLAATAGVETGTPSGGVTPVNITTVGLDAGVVGTPYSKTLVATGGTLPYIWSRPSGTWPAGISMSSAGVISGTPTTAGSQTVTVRATDSTGGTPLFDDQVLTLTINAAPTPLAIPTASPLPSAQVPLPYSAVVSATGGTAPYQWSQTAGTMPPGITVNTNTGEVAGIPTTAGTYNFTLQVADAVSANATKAFTLVVTAETVACTDRQQRWNYNTGVFYRSGLPLTAKECPQIGDINVNISTDPIEMRIVRSITPTVELTDPVSFSAIALPVSQPDDLLVGDNAGGYTRLGVGAVGAVLMNSGDGLTWSSGIPPAMLGTGVASTSTFLRGDGTWAVPPTGGSGGAVLLTFFADDSNSTWALDTTANQFNISNDIFYDLTGKTECRLFMRANSSDGIAWVRYSTTNATTTLDLGTTSESPSVNMISPTDNFILGSWAPIATGAKTFVRLGVWGRSPTGADNTAIRNIGLVCR